MSCACSKKYGSSFLLTSKLLSICSFLLRLPCRFRQTATFPPYSPNYLGTSTLAVRKKRIIGSLNVFMLFEDPREYVLLLFIVHGVSHQGKVRVQVGRRVAKLFRSPERRGPLHTNLFDLIRSISSSALSLTITWFM